MDLVIRFLRRLLDVSSILIRFSSDDVFGSLLHFVEVLASAIKFSHTNKVHGINEQPMLNLKINW